MANIRDDWASRPATDYTHADLSGVKPVSPQICTRQHVSDRSLARTCRWTWSVPVLKRDGDGQEDEETRAGEGEKRQEGGERNEKRRRTRRRKRRSRGGGGGGGGTQSLSKSERLSVSSIPTHDLDQQQSRSACLPSSLCLALSFFYRVLPPFPSAIQYERLATCSGTNTSSRATLSTARTHRLSLMPRG